jgi:hypothetical protein
MNKHQLSTLLRTLADLVDDVNTPPIAVPAPEYLHTPPRVNPTPHIKTPPQFYTPRNNQGQRVLFEGKEYPSIRQACVLTGATTWKVTTYGKRLA